MNIALAHFRVGETDGVSLEMEKWREALIRMGHQVLFLAGSEGQASAHVIPELHYKHPMNEKFTFNAFDKQIDYESEQEFADDVMFFAKRMEDQLIDFIEMEQIELLIAFNLLSLGWSLPAGIALTTALEKTGIPCAAFHNNFFWQRDNYSRPTCSIVNDWLERFFPPDLSNVVHIVSNSLYQKELKERRHLNAVVIPNVFDFDGESWTGDSYNATLRQDIGVNEDDIVILQATRVTERKTIELGIDVVAQLQLRVEALKRRKATLYNGKQLSERSRVVYVLAGMPESSYEYTEKLRIKAEHLGIDMRYISSKISHSRTYSDGGKKYSLWDAYVISDFVTFPSVVEGWGNQLLEAVYARKPLLIYEYPVYKEDIRNYGFHFVSLGSSHRWMEDGLASVDSPIVEAAAQQMAELLAGANQYMRTVQHNFQIGKTSFSFDSLHQLLKPLIEEVEKND
ncbi:glycosyltransferase family 4 protein [Paenibacillus aestuarii]|uniref:Glycosyltransferase family 4 protein n=1 Tax=Paenibacillus aestuarii TaxID=516965 RepID=A0ABW0KJ95_9BACL|nr:glycosyltransferase family 4 protein [Paenibacillus aestuarii]